MPQLPSEVIASDANPGWTGIEARLFHAIDEANGSARAADGSINPRVTYRQAVAIVRAWHKVAPDWGNWYPLTIYSLGYGKPGDRFIVTEQWQDTSLPGDAADSLWQTTRDLAKRLDAAGRKATRLRLDWSRGAYLAAAHEAYLRMLSDRGGGRAPTRSKSAGGGLGILLVMIAAAWIATR